MKTGAGGGAGVVTVLLVAAVSGVRPAVAGTKAPVTTTVPVTTSRGVYDMIVYPPAAPPGAPPMPAAASAAAAPAGDPKPIVLIASGEFGWRHFDDLISGMLSADGYWVGGIDAMKYFWEAQDDRQVLSSDLRAFASALAKSAGREAQAPLVLGGFSFGADLSPWVAGAGGWNGRILGLLMIGPDETGSLLFRVSEMIGFKPKEHIFRVAEALRSAAGFPTVFIHGEKDSMSDAPALAAQTADPKKLIVVPGATHHFGGHEEPLRSALREGMEWLLHQNARKPDTPGKQP